MACSLKDILPGALELCNLSQLGNLSLGLDTCPREIRCFTKPFHMGTGRHAFQYCKGKFVFILSKDCCQPETDSKKRVNNDKTHCALYSEHYLVTESHKLLILFLNLVTLRLVSFCHSVVHGGTAEYKNILLSLERV